MSLADEYTALIEEALSEVRDNHFVEARALFARAHALYPNARTLRGLGMMSYELRAYAESIDFFEQALSSDEKPLDASLRKDAEALMKRARRFVATLRLAVNPPNLQVTVDGKDARVTPVGALRVDAGTHTLGFHAPGYDSQNRKLDVRGGETLVWTITLTLSAPTPAPMLVSTPEPREQPAVPAPRPADQPLKERRKLYKNPWLWIGVVVAAGAIATAVGIATTRDAKTVEMAPIETRNSPPDGIIQTLRGAP
jgi:hypothetical protein